MSFKIDYPSLFLEVACENETVTGITEDALNQKEYKNLRRILWQCKSCQTRWLDTLESRLEDKNCPICESRKGTDCLAETLEAFAEQIKPGWEGCSFSENRYSPALIPWKCKEKNCGFEWEARIAQRIGKKKKPTLPHCPSCTGKIVTVQNCLKTVFPELAKELHDSYKHFAEAVYYKSSATPLWKCKDCKNEWYAPVYDRTLGTHSCPTCSNPRVDYRKEDCLAETHPELAKELHPDFAYCAFYFKASSTRKVLWRCRECKWEWIININTRGVIGNNCPACVGQVPTPTTCIAYVLPLLAKELAPGWEYKAYEVTAGSGEKIMWHCQNNGCDHEWLANVPKRREGKACPKCANRYVDKDNSFAHFHPELAKELHPRFAHLANEVPKHAKMTALWVCRKCKCQWQTTFDKRAAGRGCPRCRGSWSIHHAKFHLSRELTLWSALDEYELEAYFESTTMLHSRGKIRTLISIMLGNSHPTDLLQYINGMPAPETEELMKSHKPSNYGIRENIPAALKRKVIQEKGTICFCCGKQCSTGKDVLWSDKLNLDHEYPMTLGGKTSFENIQPLCGVCNSIKSSRVVTLEELKVMVDAYLLKQKELKKKIKIRNDG